MKRVSSPARSPVGPAARARRWTRARGAVLVALALGGAAFACQVVAGIERVEKVAPPPEPPPPPPPPEAGVDPCVHAVPPPAPLVDDYPNDKLPEIYLALRTVRLMPPAGQPLPGWDLDGVCTCEKGAPTAYDGGVSCGSAAVPQCDLDGGVDNQAGRALQDFAQFVDVDKAAYINQQIENGVQTAIVVITNYNGRANDKGIGIGLFTSEGMRVPSPCAGSGASSTAGFFTPGWCGEDTWTATTNTLTTTLPPFVPKSVGSGYVSNYRFVVRLNGVASIPFAGYRLEISSPVTSGLLVPLDDQLQPLDTRTNPEPSTIKHWRLAETVLGGRIGASALLAALGTAVTPGADAGPGVKVPPLCTSNLFATAKATLCAQVDMGSTASLDFTPGVPCDALSMAVAITADQVNVAGALDHEDAGNECYPTADGGGPVNGPPGLTYSCP